MIHSGSRHLGLEVAKHYQKQAIAYHKTKSDNSDVLNKLKAEGRHKEIESELAKLKAQREYVPDELAYCEGVLFDQYIHDMNIVQEFAKLNRMIMSHIIIGKMGWTEVERFTTIHNYIDTESMILRKGAVSAKQGEKLIIPINMRDGSLICVGKGNEDWNQSAPHGAGRLMSRSRAKEEIKLEDFKETMAGIYSTSVNQSTIDESPMAYKPIESITDNIKDTVDILEIIKPVYNFKAST